MRNRLNGVLQLAIKSGLSTNCSEDAVVAATYFTERGVFFHDSVKVLSGHLSLFSS